MYVNDVGSIQEAWHWTRAGPGRYREGHEKRPSRDQRTGLVWLCRKKRVLAIEVEIVKRANAYFVRENPIVAHRHHAVAR
jgi:hypothetical protein